MTTLERQERIAKLFTAKARGEMTHTDFRIAMMRLEREATR